MYAIGALGAMYLGGVAMENQAKIAKDMDPKAGYRNVHIYTQDNKQDYVHLLTPDFWREDAEWQHAILESGTYYLKDPNIETLPTYFQALSDWHYPGQFPIVEPANFDVFGQQYEYFYPVDYQYSLTTPPS